MSDPTVAVCVGFRPRNTHDQRCWDWVRTRWETVFPEYQICVADSGHERFNRSASRNLAARQADDSTVLVFSNSDTTFRFADDLRAAVRSADAGRWVLASQYVETSEAWTGRVLETDPAGDVPDPLSGYDRQLPNSPAGPQVVSAEQFWAGGAWDEAFVSWGHEDRALSIVLDTLYGSHAKIGEAVHLWHPRTKEEAPWNNTAGKRRVFSLYHRAGRGGPTSMRSFLTQRESSST